MNRRTTLKFFGVAPFIKVPKDRTLYELLTGKKHELQMFSYDRTGLLSMFDYYELEKITNSQCGQIEKDIIGRIESVDWVYHRARLIVNDSLGREVYTMIIYKDHFGTYRYRILEKE